MSTMFVSSPRGLIIPAAVLGAAADRHAKPGEAIEVPTSYGRHLVADRFAAEVEAPAERETDASKMTKDELIAERERRGLEARASLNKAELLALLEG